MTETWTKNGVLWPKELLPKDVPKSRIYLFGYDTGITHWDQNEVQRTEIHSDADDLCARLDAERSKTNTVSRSSFPFRSLFSLSPINDQQSFIRL
jgi:protein SERAC1